MGIAVCSCWSSWLIQRRTYEIHEIVAVRYGLECGVALISEFGFFFAPSMISLKSSLETNIIGTS